MSLKKIYKLKQPSLMAQIRFLFGSRKWHIGFHLAVKKEFKLVTVQMDKSSKQLCKKCQKSNQKIDQHSHTLSYKFLDIPFSHH